MKKGRISALLPILVFLVLYLGLGITFEYIMKIPMAWGNAIGIFVVPETLRRWRPMVVRCRSVNGNHILRNVYRVTF